jgi:hypothetical protein
MKKSLWGIMNVGKKADLYPYHGLDFFLFGGIYIVYTEGK